MGHTLPVPYMETSRRRSCPRPRGVGDTRCRPIDDSRHLQQVPASPRAPTHLREPSVGCDDALLLALQLVLLDVGPEARGDLGARQLRGAAEELAECRAQLDRSGERVRRHGKGSCRGEECKDLYREVLIGGQLTCISRPLRRFMLSCCCAALLRSCAQQLALLSYPIMDGSSRKRKPTESPSAAPQSGGASFCHAACVTHQRHICFAARNVPAASTHKAPILTRNHPHPSAQALVQLRMSLKSSSLRTPMRM